MAIKNRQVQCSTQTLPEQTQGRDDHSNCEDMMTASVGHCQTKQQN